MEASGNILNQKEGIMTRSQHSHGPLPGEEAQPLLQVHHLAKSFQGLQAVADVNISLSPGQVIGIIGPNGSGKSTTIDLISGFIKPDSGDIRLRGRSIVCGGRSRAGTVQDLPERQGLPHHERGGERSGGIP